MASKKNTSYDSEYDYLIDEISKYDIIDFLASVSALMLFPQNQSKAIVFQTMICAVLTIPKSKFNLKNKMSITKFKQIVRDFEKSSVSYLVDPPEFPFILPVIYFNNPYVFMGNNSLSSIYLNNLLKVFESNKRILGYDKYYLIRKVVDGLLSLSDNIVKSLDIRFESLSYYSTDIDIYVPDKETLEIYKKKVILSSEDMQIIFDNNIDNYIIEFECLDKSNILFDKNPIFIYKPFIKYEDIYVLLDVTCILPLLFNFIIKETINLESIDFVKNYYKLNSMQLTKEMFMLGFQKTELDYIYIIKEDDYEEKIFSEDDEIFVISIQLFENKKAYNTDNANVTTELERDNDFISKRISYISELMIKNGISPNNIFVIITPYSLGGRFTYFLDGCNPNDLLILALYELDAISINERNNRYFLKEYIDTRKYLKHYIKGAFSELNTIALFVKNNYTFYSSDNIDVKDSHVYVNGEYSSDYILKSYLTEPKKLCQFYKSNSLIEVIKIDRSIYMSPELLLEKELNKVLIDNSSTLWVISTLENIFNHDLYNWFSDLILYWLNEILPLKGDSYNIVIKLENINQLYEFKKIEVLDDVSLYFKYKIENNILIINITEELCNYFNCDYNYREKEFIKYLLEILNKNFDICYDMEKLENAFSNPYKKKIINIDIIDEAYMVPPNKNTCNQVSAANENIILDKVGLYLKNEKNFEYGIIDDKGVFNSVVDYLYNNLVNRLKKYNKYDLVKYLYYLYDNNLGNSLIRQYHYANDISCYPEHKTEIEANINNMTKLSLSLRFMIELVSSFIENPEVSKKKISFYDLNYDIALSSEIIEYAYTNDLLFYNLIDSNVVFLQSNRIGFDKTNVNKINEIMRNSMLIKNSIFGIEKEKEIKKFLPQTNEKGNFKEAFEAEFGYSFDDYAKVIAVILDLFNDNYNSLLIFNSDNIKLNLDIDISEIIIKTILNDLALEERDDFLKPPPPYKKEDIFPWRFNRPLSFIRKPIVKMEDKYIVRYRTLVNSVQFLLSLISEGRYHAETMIMKNYISKRNIIKGQQFNDQVFNYLSNFNSLIVSKNIKKINKKHISDINNNPLGDIDILYVSEKKKTIGIVETKNFSISKNYYEISNEYKKMFDLKKKNCLYNKHKRRVEWVKEHLGDLIIEYNLPNTNWKIKDMFIVEDYIVSKEVYGINVEIYTLKDLLEKNLY